MWAREVIEGVNGEGDDAKGKPVESASPLKHVVST